jgi:hypothetical protein
MSTAKKTVAGVLAFLAGVAFHNLCLSLTAGLLVPTRSLRADLIACTFFAVILVGGAAGAAKLWDRWREVFGFSMIATALMTGSLMMANQPGPPPTGREKAAAYITVAVVGAVGAIVVIRKRRQPAA